MVKKREKLRILAAGDFHGKAEVAESLSKRAEKEKVDLVILAGDLHGHNKFSPGIIAPFKKRNQTVLFVPGNWDTSAESALLTEMYGIDNINGYYKTIRDVDIIGIGNPDWDLYPNQKKTLEKLIKNFEKTKNKKTKKILVSHLHAAGSQAEFSGLKGDKAVRKAIDYFQPDVFISGHIHEAEGIEEKIGKTKVMNVGRKGTIFEI